MNNRVRDAVFEHEMFEANGGEVGYALDSVRRREAAWEFSEAQVSAELGNMLGEGLVACSDHVWWSATPNGRQLREKRWQELGRRHPTLAEQLAKIGDLIVALVAAGHSDLQPMANETLVERSLPIYLWKLAVQDIDSAVQALIARGLIQSLEPPFTVGRCELQLTADGIICYAQQVIPRLGLVPPMSILHPIEAHVPTFSSLDIDLALADNLRFRWEEAERCVRARAWLAATILYGSVLEAVLLAILSKDAEAARKASQAPKALALDRWSLATMIDVAVELDQIDATLAKFGHALRESRNLIHPAKQIRERSESDQNLARISKLVVESVLRKFARDSDDALI